MKEGIDPYFERRLKKGEKHRAVGSIDLSAHRTKEGEPNKELPNPVLEGTIDEFGWSKKSVDNIIDAVKRGHIKITRVGGEQLRIELLPLVEVPDQLAQVSELDVVRDNLVEDKNVYGSKNPDEFTYLQTTDFAVEGYMDDEQEGKRYGRVWVNSSRLTEDRNVYLDPESIHVTDYEYGHAFCVYGGVPFRAIQKIDIIQAKKLEEENFEIDTSSWIDDPEEEMNAQARRLKHYLDTAGV